MDAPTIFLPMLSLLPFAVVGSFLAALAQGQQHRYGAGAGVVRGDVVVKRFTLAIR